MPVDDDLSTVIEGILGVCKRGCTKEKIIEETHLSHDQLRRITAEIVDRGFLRYIEHQEIYITTDKGYIFLDSRENSQEIRGNNNKTNNVVATKFLNSKFIL